MSTAQDQNSRIDNLEGEVANLRVIVGQILDRQSRDLEQRFQQLLEEWRAGRGPTSSIERMSLHPAYQQIIGLGPGAIPLLLRELEQRPGHYFWALRALTGIDPVPKESRGKLQESAAAWLAWGRAQGYATPFCELAS